MLAHQPVSRSIRLRCINLKIYSFDFLQSKISCIIYGSFPNNFQTLKSEKDNIIGMRTNIYRRRMSKSTQGVTRNSVCYLIGLEEYSQSGVRTLGGSGCGWLNQPQTNVRLKHLNQHGVYYDKIDPFIIKHIYFDLSRIFLKH